MGEVPAPVWIDSDAALAHVMADVGSVIAVDTEFQRTDTFFPLAGLFQVCSGDAVWLLDPLVIKDFTPFVRVLEDASVTKVMHACLEDLELFWCHLGARPLNVFDTQLACAYVNTRWSIGLVSLIEAEIGVQLQQSHTRSDWLRRPLSAGQLRYAAEDVWYLPALHSILQGKLAASGRLTWFVEDMNRFGIHEPEAPEAYYASVHRAWLLDTPALGRLQALCTWRELTARNINIPRKRVLPDETLFDLARAELVSPEMLARFMSPGAVRRFSAEIMRIHAGSAPATESVEAPLTPGEGRQVKRLREVAAALAEEWKFAPELVARKRDLEALFRHFRESGTLSPVYSGWRRDVVGQQLLAALGGQ
jgi:ribonuclease D